MLYGKFEKSLSALIGKASQEALRGHGAANPPAFDIQLEIPKEASFGDLSTNIAFRLAPSLRKSPVESAQILAEALKREMDSSDLRFAIERLEVKSPGFINFVLSNDYLAKVLLDVNREKNRYGSSGMGRKEKALLEFVSANPTGPLTIAHARQAAVGNALANILEFSGYSITREYYINDEGVQMGILADSIRVRYLELCGIPEEFPQDGYKGSYIADIAKAFKARYGERYTKGKDTAPFREFGYRWIMADIKKDLKDFGVKFGLWYSQAALVRKGKVRKALAILRDRGYIYEKEGAAWFRSTEFGDDKDRVVIKSDGSLTYLATDIAYHLDKYKRAFRKLIDIWGPDHHGYIARIKAVVRAFGYDASSIDTLIVQLATLLREGKAVSMSTRAGEFVTLREIIDEVGSDAAKFIFLGRKLDSHLDFDLDMAKDESMENPVYYIQYAYARINSIKQYAKARRGKAFNSKLLKGPEEITLLRLLRQFPLVVQLSASRLEPNGITTYLHNLASSFHNFYNKIRVVSDDEALTVARLVLVDSVGEVLANGLRLLGVSLPKKM